MSHLAAQRSFETATPLPAQAAARYRQLDLSSRIAAASPHALIAMLYDGLIEALGAAARATGVTGGAHAATRIRAVTRALAILDALDASLDHSRGGSVARALSDAYANARALTVAGNADARPELLAAAAAQIGEIAASWRAIG